MNDTREQRRLAARCSVVMVDSPIVEQMFRRLARTGAGYLMIVDRLTGRWQGVVMSTDEIDGRTRGTFEAATAWGLWRQMHRAITNDHRRRRKLKRWERRTRREVCRYMQTWSRRWGASAAETLEKPSHYTSSTAAR